MTTGTIELGDIKVDTTKQYQSIVISSNKLKTNTEYELKIDGKTNQTIKLTDTVTSIGNGGMNNRGMKGGRR